VVIVWHGQTDIGKRRKINEDSIIASDGLFVVCDGVGGQNAGEVASRLAVETIARFIERSAEDRELTWPYGFDPRLSYNANRLGTAIKLANRAVFKHAGSAAEYTGMGTTVAAVLVSPGSRGMTYAHVGDSRVYLMRDQNLRQLTRDDTWASVAWGGTPPDDTATSPGLKNILTKALGPREDVEFEVIDHPVTSGDAVLLCSDGLTNMVPDARILEITVAHLPDLAAGCRELVAEANAQGGRDNISVILVYCQS